jgi:hypothetical protein
VTPTSDCWNPPTGHGGYVREAMPYYLADGRIRLLTACDDQAATLRVGGGCNVMIRRHQADDLIALRIRSCSRITADRCH